MTWYEIQVWVSCISLSVHSVSERSSSPAFKKLRNLSKKNMHTTNILWYQGFVFAAKTDWPIGSGQERKSWFFRSNQIQRGDLIISPLLLNFFPLLVWNLNVYPFKDVSWSPYTGFIINLWFFVFFWAKRGKLSQCPPRGDAFNLGVVDYLPTPHALMFLEMIITHSHLLHFVM